MSLPTEIYQVGNLAAIGNIWTGDQKMKHHDIDRMISVRCKLEYGTNPNVHLHSTKHCVPSKLDNEKIVIREICADLAGVFIDRL